jgi:Fic family protein
MDWKNHPYHFQGFEKQLDRLTDKKARLDALRPLPDAAVRNIRQSLTLEWTWHSNAIEGNTLTLRETKMIVEDGLTVGGKSLREHFEVLNHQEAITLVERLAAGGDALKTEDLLSLHAMIMQKIDASFAGRYRNAGVRIGGANFVPPNALKIGVLVEELFEWTHDPVNKLPTVAKAAIFHHRFVWIHPFFDGNGRTARLLSNLLLMKAGFPPAIILKNDRKKYYDALNKANQGDYAKILLLTMQALERSLDIYLSNLSNSYDDYQPISDIVGEADFPYSQEYVSLLARQGKIDAFKEGRNWLTTKKAVEQYMESRERKRD